MPQYDQAIREGAVDVTDFPRVEKSPEGFRTVVQFKNNIDEGTKQRILQQARQNGVFPSEYVIGTFRVRVEEPTRDQQLRIISSQNPTPETLRGLRQIGELSPNEARALREIEVQKEQRSQFVPQTSTSSTQFQQETTPSFYQNYVPYSQKKYYNDFLKSEPQKTEVPKSFYQSYAPYKASKYSNGFFQTRASSSSFGITPTKGSTPNFEEIILGTETGVVPRTSKAYEEGEKQFGVIGGTFFGGLEATFGTGRKIAVSGGEAFGNLLIGNKQTPTDLPLFTGTGAEFLGVKPKSSVVGLSGSNLEQVPVGKETIGELFGLGFDILNLKGISGSGTITKANITSEAKFIGNLTKEGVEFKGIETITQKSRIPFFLKKTDVLIQGTAKTEEFLPIVQETTGSAKSTIKKLSLRKELPEKITSFSNTSKSLDVALIQSKTKSFGIEQGNQKLKDFTKLPEQFAQTEVTGTINIQKPRRELSLPKVSFSFPKKTNASRIELGMDIERYGPNIEKSFINAKQNQTPFKTVSVQRIKTLAQKDSKQAFTSLEKGLYGSSITPEQKILEKQGSEILLRKKNLPSTEVKRGELSNNFFGSRRAQETIKGIKREPEGIFFKNRFFEKPFKSLEGGFKIKSRGLKESFSLGLGQHAKDYEVIVQSGKIKGGKFGKAKSTTNLKSIILIAPKTETTLLENERIINFGRAGQKVLPGGETKKLLGYKPYLENGKIEPRKLLRDTSYPEKKVGFVGTKSILRNPETAKKITSNRFAYRTFPTTGIIQGGTVIQNARTAQLLTPKVETKISPKAQTFQIGEALSKAQSGEGIAQLGKTKQFQSKGALSNAQVGNLTTPRISTSKLKNAKGIAPLTTSSIASATKEAQKVSFSLGISLGELHSPKEKGTERYKQLSSLQFYNTRQREKLRIGFRSAQNLRQAQAEATRTLTIQQFSPRFTLPPITPRTIPTRGLPFELSLKGAGTDPPGYFGYVKEEPHKQSRFIKVTPKPISAEAARAKTQDVLDNTIAQTGYIRKVKNSKATSDNAISFINFKFRANKKDPNKFTEKRDFAIDTLGEKNKLKVSKYLKQKNKKVLNFLGGFR